MPGGGGVGGRGEVVCVCAREKQGDGAKTNENGGERKRVVSSECGERGLSERE